MKRRNRAFSLILCMGLILWAAMGPCSFWAKGEVQDGTVRAGSPGQGIRTDKDGALGFGEMVGGGLGELAGAFAGRMGAGDGQVMAYQSGFEGKSRTWRDLADIHRRTIGRVSLGACLIFAGAAAWKKNKEKNQAMEQIRTQNKRLQKLSQILDECLFEYSYATDRLILQNNHLLFPGQHVVENFLKRNDYIIRDKNEQISVDALKSVLRSREKEREIRIVLEEVECWYCIKMGVVDENYVIGRIADVSKSAIERKELRRRASTDSLTGLLNRSALKQYLNAYLQNGLQNGFCEGVFLLMDLDNFKNINDTLGHDRGDELLKAFASHLQKSFRSSDMKARLGGDEFAVFMPGHFEGRILEEKLSSLLAGLNQEVFAAYQAQGLSASIGAAFIKEKTEIAADLYKEADSAMYVAKRGGKNSFFISDGTACMRRNCIGCRTTCKKREYLEKRQEGTRSSV
ncbi:MAG: GGDEF domain-containing protein [Eubacteriales bacterium]|nr:GGDEF domain-containing protein [Eubacteriales bacterium]